MINSSASPLHPSYLLLREGTGRQGEQHQTMTLPIDISVGQGSMEVEVEKNVAFCSSTGSNWKPTKTSRPVSK